MSVKRMTLAEIQAYREAERAAMKDTQAEALATEGTAVYNLELIRKLEGRIEVSEAELHSRWVPHLGDRINALEARLEAQADAIAATSALLGREREKSAMLTRLVERMGNVLESIAIEVWGNNWRPMVENSFTLQSQREYDAAMHEAEGPPVTRESEGAWGYE